MQHNVISHVTTNNLCIGCGICVALCPMNALEIRFNAYGEYQVFATGAKCLLKCSICLDVCPFSNITKNEDVISQHLFQHINGISYKKSIGFYQETLVGYVADKDHRLQSASGGLTTWFLKTLLERDMVDKIVCVRHSTSSDALFSFTVASTTDEVLYSAKSCYYPVEMSGVISKILKSEARYAVVGLPCFLKGIRLAMLKNKKLRDRIYFLAGLVCGQTKSKFFAEYLCAMKGGIPRYLSDVTFRLKDSCRPANDFGMAFTCSAGNVRSGQVFWLEGMDKVWINGYFKPNPCSYCDDTFSEVADIVFLDAWMDPYKKNYRGTNLVVVRNSKCLQILKKGRNIKEIQLQNVSVDEVIKTQQGVIDVKTVGLANRLGVMGALLKINLPTKRISPAKLANISLLSIIDILLDQWRIRMSRKAFRIQRERSGLSYFRMRLIPVSIMYSLRNSRKMITGQIRRVASKIKRELCFLAKNHTKRKGLK